MHWGQADVEPDCSTPHPGSRRDVGRLRYAGYAGRRMPASAARPRLVTVVGKRADATSYPAGPGRRTRAVPAPPRLAAVGCAGLDSDELPRPVKCRGADGSIVGISPLITPALEGAIFFHPR